MSLFSPSEKSGKPGSGKDPVIFQLTEACRRLAAGEVVSPLDIGGAVGAQAALIAAFNDAFAARPAPSPGSDPRVEQITAFVKQVTDGNFEGRLIGIEGDDPVAALMHALNDLTDIVDAFVRESGASLDASSRGVYYRKIITTGLKGEFLRTAENVNMATSGMGQKVEEFETLTTKLVANIQNVATAVESIENTAVDVSQNADNTNERSTTVVAAAEETSNSVQTVAASAEQMQASIGEISRQMDQAAAIAANAIGHMEESNRAMQDLSNAAENIGQAVKLISDIAGQTNLLALNATIEAARAGDAGRGFAVVASEVKTLATQTARATEDISQLVSEIQKATTGSVDSMETVGSTVGEINSICSNVAAAIVEQESATSEISRSMSVAGQAR